MSRTAIHPLTTPNTILAFKAGRAFRREGSNFVDPSPEKGALLIEREDDELLHLLWKNRTTQDTVEVRTNLGCLCPTDAQQRTVGSHPLPDRCDVYACQRGGQWARLRPEVLIF